MDQNRGRIWHVHPHGYPLQHYARGKILHDWDGAQLQAHEHNEYNDIHWKQEEAMQIPVKLRKVEHASTDAKPRWFATLELANKSDAERLEMQLGNHLNLNNQSSLPLDQYPTPTLVQELAKRLA